MSFAEKNWKNTWNKYDKKLVSLCLKFMLK